MGRRGLLRLCVTKLARIEDPETKLCKAVLINNTLRKIQRDNVSEYPEEMEEMGEECEEDVEEEEEETEAAIEERDDEGAERLEGEATVTSLALYKDVINDFGKIDILVNNAGIKKDNLLMRMNKEDFDSVVNTNLSSVFNLTKASIRTFLKQRKYAICSVVFL